MDRDRIVHLVWDLVDNMSSMSSGQDMFYVDTSWAEDLIQAVLHGDPEPTYEPVGWVSVSRQSFHPNDDLPAGRFVVYKREQQR